VEKYRRFAELLQPSKESRVPWLGDSYVVEGLLRSFAKEAMDRRNACAMDELRPEEWKQLDRDACLQLADIFLGKNPFFNSVPGWNEPGKIDVFLVREFNLGDTDPILRVATVLAELLLEMVNVAKYASQEGVVEEQWVWQVDAAIETYRNYMIGIVIPFDDCL
jgi:hypothetical protein